ncbi:MAG: hydrolase [Candidatus Rokuibacteriota bacterium]|nr:MAG: hydrolase [Candidatus Rokubacteria bacterium]
MRASAVQLNSNEDKSRNLEIAERLVRRAAGERAELVVLPEKFNVIGTPEDLAAGAEALDGPTLRWAGALARELGIWLVAGSIVERVEGDDKLRNTSVLFDPDGVRRALYRKIHMFDVEVGGVTYSESDVEAAGDEIVVADAEVLRLGLAICYDLRFPELFRIMAVQGAQVFTLPSAFTVPTGRAHWEVLVRARAIENQAFVIAAGQVGPHPPDHESYGHSMIVDAWGTVLARASDEPEQVVVADLDVDAQSGVRAKLPSLANRRPDAYRWPHESLAGTR